MLQITPQIAVDEAELEISAVRASGPGGQNVNKVSTAVQLRWDAMHSPSLPADVAARLKRIAGRQISDDGVLQIRAMRFRTQERNRRDAIERLVELVRQAAVEPRSRRPTRPTRASQERRLRGKRERSSIKRSRAARSDHEDRE